MGSISASPELQTISSSTSEESSSVAATPLTVEPKVSAVVSALRNADILSLVLSEFRATLNDTKEKRLTSSKDLLNAARTCTWFVEPALDVLWCVLPSMLPLFKLLPGFGLVNGVYVLEDIIEGDWVRYNIHARRVRVLDLSDPLPGNARISSYAYSRICRHRKQPLLPALASVYTTPQPNTTIDYTPIFITLHSNVNFVWLGKPVVDNSEIFQPILAALQSDVPLLRELQIEGEGEVNIGPIARFKNLTILDLYVTGTHLSPGFMNKLGDLEQLEELKLHVGPDAPSIVPPLLRSIPHNSGKAKGGKNLTSKFRNLKSLELTGKISSVSRVLEHMQLENLVLFTVVEEQDPSANASSANMFWMQAFQSISASRSLVTLDIVQLKTRTTHSGYSLSASSFRPLYTSKTRTLRKIRIENASVNISDDDVFLLAGAFPGLRELILPERCHDQTPTFASLLYLSLHCPHLEKVEMAIGPPSPPPTGKIVDTVITDISTRLIVEIPLRPKRHTHNLNTLRLSSSFGKLGLSQLTVVARFLHRAFPELEILEGFGDRVAQESWSEVRELQMVLQMEARGI